MAVKVLARADATTTLRRGAIISIYPIEQPWGTEELSDRFYRITVSDADYDDVIQYVDRIADAEGNIIETRRYHLPASVCDVLDANNGDLTVTLSETQAAMVDLSG